MAVFADHYATLGVAADADDFVIHAAWKALQRKYHPDANREAGASERATAINEAYDVLRNTSRRYHYDQIRLARHRVSARYDPCIVPPIQPSLSESSRSRLGRVILAVAMAFVVLVLNQHNAKGVVEMHQRLADALLFRAAAANIFVHRAQWAIAEQTTCLDTRASACDAHPRNLAVTRDQDPRQVPINTDARRCLVKGVCHYKRHLK